MTKDINGAVFTEETRLKLGILRECFREWFPVFIHNSHIEQIFIYDLFAGSGTDIEGTSGSPLILLEEARGEDGEHCRYFDHNSKKISFGYNELGQEKSDELSVNVKEFFAKCKLSCKNEVCHYENNCYFENKDFRQLFESKQMKDKLKNPKFGKFIFLDQYGFKNVDEAVFTELTGSPKTDYIFFISSSLIKRFKDSDVVKKYLNDHEITFNDTTPKECHRVIANYFKSMVPKSKEYYLHHFTIKNGSNYYGLIFGSNHSLGMEKFLKVCWKYDKFSGESNCNIDNDFGAGTLFSDCVETNKVEKTKDILKKAIMSGEIDSNIGGFKYALRLGCLPKIYVEVIDELQKNNKIEITGEFNRACLNIHKVKKYKISVNENNKDRMDG